MAIKVDFMLTFSSSFLVLLEEISIRRIIFMIEKYSDFSAK